MVNLSSSTHPAAARSSAAAAPARSSALHWTPEKMVTFIQVLAETFSVTGAAKSVGMSRQSAYRLRSRMVGQPFDIAWEGAFEFGLQQVAHESLDRAMNGTVIPIFYKGEQVGERRVFNERAAQNLMRGGQEIGRNHPARDWATRNWDNLLLRIFDGPESWSEAEQAAMEGKQPQNEARGLVTQERHDGGARADATAQEKGSAKASGKSGPSVRVL